MPSWDKSQILRHAVMQTMYPLTMRIEAVAFAPQVASQPPFDRLPSMQLLSDEVSESGSGRRRLHLRLDTVAPCWGAMNMTGSLAGWSFAPDLPISATSQVPLHTAKILPHHKYAAKLVVCWDQ